MNNPCENCTKYFDMLFLKCRCCSARLAYLAEKTGIDYDDLVDNRKVY